MMENKEKVKQDGSGKVLNLLFIKGFAERIRRIEQGRGQCCFQKGRALEIMLCKIRPKYPRNYLKTTST